MAFWAMTFKPPQPLQSSIQHSDEIYRHLTASEKIVKKSEAVIGFTCRQPYRRRYSLLCHARLPMLSGRG